MPKESVAGIDIIPIIKNRMVQAFALVILHLSIIDAIGTSIILIPDVTAAANSRKKNNTDTIFPCGICANIWGIVMNTSPAPELGSNPKENIAGKIIIPAVSAKNVSEKIIVYVVLVMFLSSLM